MKMLMISAIFIAFSSISNAYGADADCIRKVENYLNTITTYKAKFEQYIAGGSPANGTFYMNRPRKFLWQYESPSPQKLVSTGAHLYFVDDESDQVTQLPLNRGPAAILTQKNIKLNGEHSKVTSVKNLDGVVEIELALQETEDNEAVPSLKMTFSTKPMQLRQIVTTDQLGNTTYVTLFDIQEGTQLARNLFEYIPPHYR